jgi:PAS domain S-box-containing protein
LENESQTDDSNTLPTIPSPTSDSHQPAQLPAISKSMDRHPLEPVRTAVHDTVVDVLVSYNHDSSEGSMGQPGRSRGRKPNSPLHTNAQMMISVWRGNEGEQCFTLTFTATAPKPRQPPSHPVSWTPSSTSLVYFSQSSTSALQSGSSLSSTFSSPSDVSPTGAPVLINGAPPRLSPETVTHFQKLTKMKEAMISNMEKEYTEKLATQSEENEQQFQLICDTMPQMLWTTTPDGYHDYFSQRWYDYTGLTPEKSLGLGWQLPFHPDDMPATTKRWAHSLATGDEYTTEYRCQRADGAWRWMLGRALPLRDVKTGKIIKWFGTCTDIQGTSA